MQKREPQSVYVVPGYTFFYYGFDIPKRQAKSYKTYFRLSTKKKSESVRLQVGGRFYNARLRVAYQRSPKYPQRQVLQIFYNNEQDTLKALRKLFVYSYASTINKSKAAIKEVFELVYLGGNKFKVRVVARQKSDFDKMFDFMEDKNLFEYWQHAKAGKTDKLFMDFSRRWLPANELYNYANRINIIYVLLDTPSKTVYIGKANRFGDRVKPGVGRVGLRRWDKFKYFELAPEHNPYLEHLEAFAIAVVASLLPNNVKVKSILPRGLWLANRQLVFR